MSSENDSACWSISSFNTAEGDDFDLMDLEMDKYEAAQETRDAAENDNNTTGMEVIEEIQKILAADATDGNNIELNRQENTQQTPAAGEKNVNNAQLKTQEKPQQASATAVAPVVAASTLSGFESGSDGESSDAAEEETCKGTNHPTESNHIHHFRGHQARVWTKRTVPSLMDPKNSPFAARIQSSVLNTKKFAPDISNVKAKHRKGNKDLTLRLWELDTLAAADRLRNSHPNDKIAVLNMANPHVAGGGLMNGSVAQEEVLCMRTTLYQGLSGQLYPLRIPEVIYSPDVLVCKGFDESWAGKPLSDTEKWFVDVISAAALSRPKIAIDSQTGLEIYADASERQAMFTGVLSILQAAVRREVKRLVLGAWGCGNFHNPISEVAKIIKEVVFGTDGNLPPHNWAALGLEEIVIAIYDQDRRRKYPVWNGFLNELRPTYTLPAGTQFVATKEVCHVFRWPGSALEPESESDTHSSVSEISGHSDDDEDLGSDSSDSGDDDSAPTDPADAQLDKDVQQSLDPQYIELAKQAAEFLLKITGRDKTDTMHVGETAPTTFQERLGVEASERTPKHAYVEDDMEVDTEMHRPPVQTSQFTGELTPPPTSESLPDYESWDDSFKYSYSKR